MKMKERIQNNLDKEKYLEILHQAKRVCSQGCFNSTESINQVKNLRIDAWRARKFTIQMINFNNHIKNVLIVQLFEQPWIDSNLDVEKTIDRINEANRKSVRWALDASIFDKTIKICDEAIHNEYTRYKIIEDKIRGMGFVVHTSMGDDNISRFFLQNLLTFKQD